MICQCFNFLRLGREGYGKVHSACYDTAQYLASEIARLGRFEMIDGGDPASGIPALCWKMKPGFDANFNLFSLADRLRVRGWQAAAYTLAAHCWQPTARSSRCRGFRCAMVSAAIRLNCCWKISAKPWPISTAIPTMLFSAVKKHPASITEAKHHDRVPRTTTARSAGTLGVHHPQGLPTRGA